MVPASLHANWLSELARVPSLRICDMRSQAHKYLDAHTIRQDFDVVLFTNQGLSGAFREILTTYTHWHAIKESSSEHLVSLLRRSVKSKDKDLRRDMPNVTLFSLSFDCFIIDEGHHIKNPQTLVARAARSVTSHGRVILTGTPVQNRIRELGALFLFLRFPPFSVPQLFNACFARKKNKGQIKAGTRLLNMTNDALLGSIRSVITIRRMKDQEFDGRPIINLPDWHEQLYIYELSESAANSQYETRDLWDTDYRKYLDDLFFRNRRHWEAIRPRRTKHETLVAILRARLDVLHDKIHEARYGDLGVDAVGKLNPSQLARFQIDALSATNDDDAGEAQQRGFDRERQAYTRDLNKAQRQKLNKRRRNFLAQFEIKGHENMWRSDRLYQAAKQINRVVREARDVAASLHDPCQRNEYLATHKVLVFCEFLTALDLLEIGLKKPELGGHKVLRYDGSMTHEERNRNGYLFEEKGKDFSAGAVPDEHMIMLVTNRAGYEGINLVHATEVFIIAPVWNPSIEDQLICRAARKGQKGVVTVHRFISPDSLERYMRDLQLIKRKQIMRIMSDDYLLKKADRLTKATDTAFLEAIGHSRAKRAMERAEFDV